ncbi:hypothetical protein SEA_WARREN_25 [Microbacterium phage Warren]|nr:hypothetical protein SEA_WARREN_25 [Microbacterium phage Warren]
MTYATVATIRRDADISNRVAACIAVEGTAPYPEQWAAENAWALAAQPGWAAAWDSSIAAHPDDPDFRPGNANDVITDAMILAAVQSIQATADAARASAAAESVA